MRRTEQKIQQRGNDILAAARMLIGMVRVTERDEGGRSTFAKLTVEVELTGGGVEVWEISIERTASSH